MNLEAIQLYAILLVLLITAKLSAISATCTDFCHIDQKCVGRCALENGTNGLPANDLWCDESCRRDQCVTGCHLLSSALSSSCYSACNSTDGHARGGQAFNCLFGCNTAIALYVEEIKARMGKIAPPAPIPGSISNTSVTLGWRSNSTTSGWPYVDHGFNVSLKWCSKYQPELCNTSEAVFNVTGHLDQWVMTASDLRPYTVYQFWLVIVLAFDREPLTSEASIDIQTLASGLPSSPPVHLQAVVLDANRISVTWDPPLYPNGPLVSYSLTIQEALSRHAGSYHGSQDVVANGLRSYTFVHLKPNTTYTVSVAACNSVAGGVGPFATRQVTTFPVETLGAELKPYFLIVVDDKFIYRHERGLLEYTNSPIHKSPKHAITGLAVHARQGTLFIADDAGMVHELSLKFKSDVLNSWSIVKEQPSDDDREIEHVRALSVDWLFDWLYLVIENASGTRWVISRCKLGNGSPTHVITNITTRPSHFEVDPFNGFIVWAVNKTDVTGGLYTVDLADLGGAPISASMSGSDVERGLVKQIVNHTAIPAFKVDSINSRIFFMDNNRTVSSVPYSGQRKTVVRHAMHHTEDVSYMTYLDDAFYWINRGNSCYEEIDPNRNVFINEFQPKPNSSYTALVLCDIRSQPTPIPLMPVRNLEALFGSDSVFIRWEPPSTVPHLGRGAWQNWTYHIQMDNMERGFPIPKHYTNVTQIELKDLDPNTTYSIIVQPATDVDPRYAPLHPTSDPGHIISTSAHYVGKTLTKSDELKSIYWASDNGQIYQSNSLGKRIRDFLSFDPSYSEHHNQQQPISKESITVVVSMAWMHNSMYVVTNKRQLYQIDLVTRRRTLLEGISEVVSVATDWLARKIYWSSARRQAIARSLANGSETEWLPIIGIATSMAVHSTKGKLVWCTGHSVEGGFLNGDELHTYWSSDPYSGNQAVGMTIDFESDNVYWLVKKLNGASQMFRAHIDNPVNTPWIASIAPSARGPLQYMSHRLLWLQDDKAVISDMNGANIYRFNVTGNQRISCFLTTLVPRSVTIPAPVVIPHKVDTTSIKLNLTAKGELIVTWGSVASVSYGRVSYEIRINSTSDNITMVTYQTQYVVPTHRKIPPHTGLFISIRAFTVWGSALDSTVLLKTPPSTPDAPLEPRAFVSFVRNQSNIQTGVLIHFRWSPPEKPNGELIGYRITCWYEKNGLQHLLPEFQNTIIPANVTDFVVRHLKANENYFFTVKASTEVGFGPETQPLSVSTSAETTIPYLVIFTANLLWLADLDKHASLNQSLSKRTIPVPSPPVAVAYITRYQKVYWIDSLSDLYSHDLMSDDIKKILHLNGTGQSLTIDWISLHAYWSQREIGGSSIYQLDLNKENDPDISPRLVLRDSRMVRLIEVDPFSSQLIWVSDNLNGSGTLMTTDIINGTTQPFLKSPQHCSNSNTTNIPSLALQTITTVDWSNTTNPRLLWTAFNDDIWSSDFKGCNSVLEFGSAEIKRTGRLPVSSLAVDRNYLYWTDGRERRIHKIRRSHSIIEPTNYSTSLGSVSAVTRRTEVLVELANVHQVVAFGTNFQPLPRTECLAPSILTNRVAFINSTHDSLTLSMPTPYRPPNCNRSTIVPPRYHVYYGPVLSNDSSGCQHNTSLCQMETFSEKTVILRHLLPFTQYAVYVSVTNQFWPEKFSPLGKAELFFTQAGAPSKPREVTATPLSPNSIRIQWLQPIALNGYHVRYSVHWFLDNKLEPEFENQLEIFENGTRDHTGQVRYVTNINSLTANTTYSFIVYATSVNELSNRSDVVATKTYENPSLLIMKNISSTSISLEWLSPSNLNISRHTLQMSLSKQRDDWNAIDGPADTTPNYLYTFSVANLSPLTTYSFRLKLECFLVETYFFWPADIDGVILRTKGNVPDQPLTPRMHERQDLLELWWGPWGPTAINSYLTYRYVLEMRVVEDAVLVTSGNQTEENDVNSSFATVRQMDWKPIYNGTDSLYIVHNLTSGTKYQFRVQAFNDMGASPFSEPSVPYHFKGTATSSDNTLTVIVSALIVFCSVMAILLFYVCKRIQFQSKKSCGSLPSHPVSGSEMTDLATLRELPRRDSFIQQNNAIYGVGDGDVDQELALLPHIRFEDLLITKFLGRGAFGEVFEGSTCNLPGSNQYHTKVAVKTLRKGATEQEKGEFLKEAILMSQFKHKHILRLLGVCLDADPNFILLELMEGGDLLSFLRNNRPSLREPQIDSVACCQLGLLDLVSMCVDVAKGCCYLEELHFVHRDLAARNCLVSSRDPRYRVVKIGDFGLARDIYRNDYYRKEGEGLLPVRWMAPESLVDGVFTSQTDVWSFGVLLWEILTLGQQPYPARTNLQVLHFVRTGGRLDRPPNCPDSLFELMMSCWSYEPSIRPTFTKCLAELLNLQDKLEHSPFTAVHNGHYVGSPTYGECKNKMFFQDENHNPNSKPWETIGSSSSCSYLDQLSLEQGPVLYTNDIAAMLNGLVTSSNRTAIGANRLYRSERYPSTQNPIGRRTNQVVRSNSSVQSSADSVSNARSRYLELLSDPVSCHQGYNGGYEVPRSVPYRSTRGFNNGDRMPHCSSESSHSNVGNDDQSDVTDESCLADESVFSCTNPIQSGSSNSILPTQIDD